MSLQVEVVHVLPDDCRVLPLTVDAGATVADVLALAARDLLFMDLPLEALTVGIWGEVVAREHCVAQGDRIELYAPLRVDPKEARRQRVKR